jgi:hypothetical protein
VSKEKNVAKHLANLAWTNPLASENIRVAKAWKKIFEKKIWRGDSEAEEGPASVATAGGPASSAPHPHGGTGLGGSGRGERTVVHNGGEARGSPVSGADVPGNVKTM